MMQKTLNPKPCDGGLEKKAIEACCWGCVCVCVCVCRYTPRKPHMVSRMCVDMCLRGHSSQSSGGEGLGLGLGFFCIIINS